MKLNDKVCSGQELLGRHDPAAFFQVALLLATAT